MSFLTFSPPPSEAIACPSLRQPSQRFEYHHQANASTLWPSPSSPHKVPTYLPYLPTSSHLPARCYFPIIPIHSPLPPCNQLTNSRPQSRFFLILPPFDCVVPAQSCSHLHTSPPTPRLLSRFERRHPAPRCHITTPARCPIGRPLFLSVPLGSSSEKLSHLSISSIPPRRLCSHIRLAPTV